MKNITCIEDLRQIARLRSPIPVVGHDYLTHRPESAILSAIEGEDSPF